MNATPPKILTIKSAPLNTLPGTKYYIPSVRMDIAIIKPIREEKKYFISNKENVIAARNASTKNSKKCNTTEYVGIIVS